MTHDNVTHIRLDDSLAHAGVRSASIEIPGQNPKVLRYESLDGPLSTEAGADPFLLGSLLLLMSSGFPVHVHASVTARCLWNLTELQHVWARWKPEKYSRVVITADTVEKGFPVANGAIAAFSGGVDACYTVQRHLNPGTIMDGQLEAALFIHGFDIPESDHAKFSTARIRGDAILRGTGVKSLGLRTNLRSLGQDWQDCFGLGVASCLTLFQGTYGVGLIGSSYEYESVRLKWGSSPITDYLSSTGQMEVRHDGSGASRTEKVASISAWPEAFRGLRVCWEGNNLDRNCGRCEKCIRTYLNFKAAGVDHPQCFEVLPTARDIRWVRAGTATRLDGIQESLEFALRTRRTGDWVSDLKFAVTLNRIKVTVNNVRVLRALASPVKAFARSLLPGA